MFEQNVYSRSPSAYTNVRGQRVSLGYTSVAWSEGLTPSRLNSLNKWVNDYKNEYTIRGVLPTIYQKLYTPDGMLVLEAITHIEQSGGYSKDARSAHVAHQFCLIDQGEQFDFLRHPEDMFNVDFIQMPVSENCLVDACESLPREKPFVPRPLEEVLSAFGLNRQSLHELLIALFDTLNIKRRQVLIGYDPAKVDVWADCQQLLYHIHTLMPLGTRRALGYDSLFNTGTSPDPYVLSFVPSERIERSNNGCFVRLKANEPVNVAYSYVFSDGNVCHATSSKIEERFRKSSKFTMWLDEQIGRILEADAEQSLEVTRTINQEMIDLCSGMDLRSPMALAMTSYDMLVQIRSGKRVEIDRTDNLIELAHKLKSLQPEHYQQQIGDLLQNRQAAEPICEKVLSEFVSFASGDYGDELKRIAESKLLDQFQYRLSAQGYAQAMQLEAVLPGGLFDRLMGSIYSDKKHFGLLLEKRAENIIMRGQRLSLPEMILRCEKALNLEDMNPDSSDCHFYETTIARYACAVCEMRLNDGQLDVDAEGLKALLQWADGLASDGAVKIELYDKFVAALGIELKDTEMSPVNISEFEALVEMKKEECHLRNSGEALMEAYYVHLCQGIVAHPEAISLDQTSVTWWADKAKELRYFPSASTQHNSPTTKAYTDVREKIMEAIYRAILGEESQITDIGVEWLDRALTMGHIDADQPNAWTIEMARFLYKLQILNRESIMKELVKKNSSLEELYENRNVQIAKRYDEAKEMIAVGMSRAGYVVDDKRYAVAHMFVTTGTRDQVERIADMLCRSENRSKLLDFLFKYQPDGAQGRQISSFAVFINRIVSNLCALPDSKEKRALIEQLKDSLAGFRKRNPGFDCDHLDQCIAQLEQTQPAKSRGSRLMDRFGLSNRDSR